MQSRFVLLMQLAVLLCTASSLSFAQGANLVGSCPTACNVKVSITSAKVDVAGDGTNVHVEWNVDSIAPELKVTGFRILATVQQVGKSNDNSTDVGSTQRKAIVRLSKEIKFSDISAVRATVTPLIADPAPVVVAVSSRSIIGQGKDAAVRVTWNAPPPLPCSAAFFLISATALNEKNKKLSGSNTAQLSQRSADVPLSGEVNKQGLHDPEAAVTARGSSIICPTPRTFPPEPQAIAAGTGASANPNPVVKIKDISLLNDPSGRTSSRINWEVVEPTGFKATQFDLKFDLEDLNGQISSQAPRRASGSDRSSSGPQVFTGTFRNLFVTITATFANSNNTSIITREDKQTRGLVVRETSKPEILQPQSIGLEITGIKPGSNSVRASWQATVPTGVAVTNLTVEAQLGTAKNSAVVGGQERQATVNIALPNKLNAKVFLKVIAHCRRADGSTFQVTATGTSN